MSKPRKIKPEGADGHRSRMIAKFLNSSSGDVLPRDIVEMLLYYPVKVRDTRDSAVDLMKRYNGDIESLLSAPPEELCQTDDIGPKSALLLNVVGEIVSRLKGGGDEAGSLNVITEEDIIRALLDKCITLTDDAISITFYNAANTPIETHIFDASPETFDQNDMYTLMSLAAGYNSAAVLVAHLADDPQKFPVAADVSFKRYIHDALHTTGLTLKAYYFITENEATSLNSF